MGGVVAALDAREANSSVGPLFASPPPPLTGLAGPIELPVLAEDNVSYWGQPLAVVVAETATAARAAAKAARVECASTEPVLTVEEATRPGAPVLHSQLSSNVVMSGTVTQGDAKSLLDAADNVVQGTVHMGRSSAIPLEPRSCQASWDPREERLTVHATTQMPHSVRTDLARQLGLAESDIRVIAPPLGGGFGFKFPALPEEVLTCFMSMRLGRPVRWVEEREEGLLVGAREYDMTYRASYDHTGKVLALSVTLDENIGALCASPAPLMVIVAASTFPGGYDIDDCDVTWRAVTTNKGPTNGARGFGKEATCVLLENVMDVVAHKVGIDPAEVRRLNLLTADRFPHLTAAMNLDSGDYLRALDMVLEASDYVRVREEQRNQDPANHLRIGVGVGFELTPEGLNSGGSFQRGHETATIRLDPAGSVTVLTGVTSPGTGSETGIAQLVAEQLGIPVNSVRVVQGDTDRTPFGGGSFSSRAVTSGGSAAWLAAGDLKDRLNMAAAALLGARADEIQAAGGLYCVRDDPTRAIPFGPLVHSLATLGDALPGVGAPELEATRTYVPGNTQPLPDATGRIQAYPTYAYSVHIARVEVDVLTGVTALRQLAVTHDCGTVINQALVDAQVHGCVGMGLGMALLEEERYDAAGVPLNTSFKRYMLPRINEVPGLVLRHLASPSPFTLLGTKGAGESGVGGSASAITAAIRNAVGSDPSVPLRLPLTPERVLDLIASVHTGTKGAP